MTTLLDHFRIAFAPSQVKPGKWDAELRDPNGDAVVAAIARTPAKAVKKLFKTLEDENYNFDNIKPLCKASMVLTPEMLGEAIDDAVRSKSEKKCKKKARKEKKAGKK